MMQLHVTPSHIFIASLAGKIDVVFNILENQKFHFGLEWVNGQHRNYVSKKMLHKATGEQQEGTQKS